MILGTISAVDADNGLQLIIDGEDEPTTKKYTYMASYVPSSNDRVLVEEVGGSYVIMGKVINEVASSGVERTADSATNATNSEVSDKTKGFDPSVSSESGSLVYRVDRTYNSTLGTYIVTDVILSSNTKKDFVYK